jgi:hypothetical protein
MDELRVARQVGTDATDAMAWDGFGPGWASTRQDLCAVLASRPTDVPGVVDTLRRLHEILRTLPPGRDRNRLASFNGLYLTITTEVLDDLDGDRFADPVFLAQLDVEFAALYFQALRQWLEGDPRCPRVWMVLFDRSTDTSVTQLAGAALGVNAHINGDLKLALVATWRKLGPSVDGGPQHADYGAINDIFFKYRHRLRRRLSTAWQLRLDQYDGPIDDWIQDWVVRLGRYNAWEQAQHLWSIRDEPSAVEETRFAADHAAESVGLAVVEADRRFYWLWVRLSRARRAAGAVRRRFARGSERE